jgi:hypothetical protein
MIKTSDKTKYNLYALRMNDFDELLKYLTRSNKSVFFIKVLRSNKYLYKLFQYLRYINDKGIYYYQTTCFHKKTGKQLCITELRKISYKYLIIKSNDEYYNIDFDKNLIDFIELITSFVVFNVIV